MLQEVINIIFSSALFVNALMFIPQIISLIKNKKAENISLITFFGFNLIQLATIAHGIINNDMYLAIGTSLSFIACGTVTFLIIKFRKKVI